MEPEPLDPYQTQMLGRLTDRAKGILRRRGDPLDPETLSLVNEVFVGVLRSDRAGALPEFTDDIELFKYLSRAIRNHLVTRARRRDAGHRPPEARRADVSVSQAFPASIQEPSRVLDINDALEELEQEDARLAQIVELTFFAGCTQEEVATMLEDTPYNIRRDWEFAKAWLKRRLR